MKTKLNPHSLGDEILKSRYEKSSLECALHNTKAAYNYLKYVKKMVIEHDDDVLVCAAERSLLHEYKENILAKQEAFNKYSELYGEKYYKLKSQIEKELGI